MSVRFFRISVGIVCLLGLCCVSYAQQIGVSPEPLINIPGLDTKHTISRAHYVGASSTLMMPMTLEPSVFPLFIEDNEISSFVTLINSSGVPSSALLTIRDQEGKAYTPVSIQIVAHVKVQIKVADLLQKIGASVRTGSILVTQGPELTRSSIVGQLTLSETTAAPVALTEEELVMPMLVDSQDLRSLSESATDAQLIAVTSLSTEPQHITAQCYKKGSVTTKTAILAPGGTALLYPCSKDSSQFEGISLLGESETTESAGISVHSDGPNGGFAAFGLARHTSPVTTSNFLGSLQFIDPTSLHSSALVFTGVSAGYSLSPGPHPYSAAIALANFSAQQSHITIAFHKTDVNGSVSTTTKEVVLAPQTATQVPLGQLGLETGEIGSLIVSGDQAPGDLMAKIVSSSDSAPNQLEQLAKDSLSHRNGGAHPWILQNNALSDLVLFNHSSGIEPFNVLITSDDGAQWTKQLRLAPFETRTVSINDLIRNKTPDSHDRTLPATAGSGTVVWYTAGPGIGSGHVLIRNDANSTGENFSCDQSYVLCGAWADASPTAMSIGDSGLATAQEEICVESGLEGTCGGDYMYSYDQSAGAYWTSSNDSILSVIDPYNSSGATYAGNAEGTAYLIGFVEDSWQCSATVNTPDITVADATPIITGIDPSDWPADSTAHPVTFTGQYFGTNTPTLTFDPGSGVSYSLLSYNDSQIVANITVDASTPDEDVNVSVTSNGYTGNGFQSGGGQVSPSAPPATGRVVSGNKPTVNTSISFGGPKSQGDQLIFSNASRTCSESLGLFNCSKWWLWNVEGKGVVSDDASLWTVKQTVTARAKGTYLDSNQTPHNFDDSWTQPDGPDSAFLQQPSGQTTIYWIDAPGYGHSYNVPGVAPIYSMTQVQNFSVKYCRTTTNCSTINWYLKLVVNPGGILDTINSKAALGSISTNF